MQRALLLSFLISIGSGVATAKADRFRPGVRGAMDVAEVRPADKRRLVDNALAQFEDGEELVLRRTEVVRQRRATFRPYLVGASVAVAPGSGEVYVADSDNDVVAVSDAAGKQVLRLVAVGRAPEQVVVGEDGRAWVSVRNAGEVALIRPGATVVSARAAIGGEPHGLALSADQRTLYVSVVRSGEVVALDAASLAERFRVKVAAEPRGLALTPDGDKLFVAHLLGTHVSVVDLTGSRAQVRRIALPGAKPDRVRQLVGQGGRVPNLTFALAISPSGRRIYAPHVLEDTGQNVAPEVRSSGYGAGTFEPIVATLTAIDADAEELMIGDVDVDSRASFGFNLRRFSQPRAAVVDPVHSRLFLAGLGSDDIRVLNTALKDPALGGALPGITLGTGTGPKGLAMSADGTRLYVHGAFQHALVVVDVANPKSFIQGKQARLTIGEETLPPAAAHGRQIFFSARDHRVSARGQFACASCHPEGRQDGMTWRLDKGPRQTPVLAGRLVGTEPYNWLGTKGSLVDNMKDTMGRLGGTGLPQKDLEDLELYMTKYLDPGPAGPGPALPAPPLVARGRALFHSDEVGCANCHKPGERFTDGKNHDIGSTSPEELARLLVEQGKPAPALRPPVGLTDLVREAVRALSTTQLLRVIGGRPLVSSDDLTGALVVTASALSPAIGGMLNGNLGMAIRRSSRQRLGSLGSLGVFGGLRQSGVAALTKKPAPQKPVTRLAYNTPSLEGVGQTGPYFHDGSARSLKEVLTVANAGDRMGRTSHLPSDDIDALVAYLETL